LPNTPSHWPVPIRPPATRANRKCALSALPAETVVRLFARLSRRNHTGYGLLFLDAVGDDARGDTRCQVQFVCKAEDVEDHWAIGYVGGAGILLGYAYGFRAFGAWLS
jgi:hypothetical protein